MNRALLVLTVVCALALGVAPSAQRGGRGAQPGQTARASAPIDMTGNWVSIVSEDWRWRMVTPSKGDYVGVPLNPAARKIADSWDMTRDAAQGEQCRPFGVGNIQRCQAGSRSRGRTTNTLKIDYDAGTQTRLLHFDASAVPPADKTWQGWSTASWDFRRWRRARSGRTRYGSMKVVTTRMRAGYLRKNGVPYSEDMVLTEYFDRHTEANGEEWFTVMAIAEDPKYLNEPFVVTTSFKKEPNNSKWHPTPCEIAPPAK
jgi:hypothetical protein